MGCRVIPKHFSSVLSTTNSTISIAKSRAAFPLIPTTQHATTAHKVCAVQGHSLVVCSWSHFAREELVFRILLVLHVHALLKLDPAHF